MKTVHIASSRWEEIGFDCFYWARDNLPSGWQLLSADSTANCDVFISVLYDKLLTEEFISGRRCYNFHPGILPDYRGAGAYSWALINREQETGVTLHKIEKNIDDGCIISIGRKMIVPNDTAETLFKFCMEMMFCSFKYNFKSLLEGTYETYMQMNGGHLYFRKDLEKARNISNLIKAFTFEGKPNAYWIDSKGEKHEVKWQ